VARLNTKVASRVSQGESLMALKFSISRDELRCLCGSFDAPAVQLLELRHTHFLSQMRFDARMRHAVARFRYLRPLAM
jgi:hypothetical protein